MYLRQRCKKTLKISRELAQCTSLPLAVTISRNFNENSHTGFQPSKIPLLELCIISQLLHTKNVNPFIVCSQVPAEM